MSEVVLSASPRNSLVQSQRWTVGNPSHSQRIIPDKGLFLEAEKMQLPHAYLLTISLCSEQFSTVEGNRTELDRNRQDSPGILARGQMDQLWPSLVSKSTFLSEVVQKGPSSPTRFPHSLSTPLHPRQPSSTRECVSCGAGAAPGPQWGGLSSVPSEP